MWINSSFFSLFLLVMPIPHATEFPRTVAPFHETTADRIFPIPSNTGLASTACSFVSHIEDFLFFNKTSSGDLQFWLVERFVLVEAISVGSSDLVSVLVLLSLPALTIPELPVALITWSKGVWARLYDQFSWVFEGCVRVSGSVVGLIMSFRAQITGSGSGCEIIPRLHVWSSVHHGPGSITATSSVERTVSLRDLRCVETKHGGYDFNQLPDWKLTLW